MVNFIISVTNFEDAITLEKWDLVDDHIKWAQKVIESGGKIFLQVEYENAPADVLMEISTLQEFIDWKSKLKEIIEKIKKTSIQKNRTAGSISAIHEPA